eukprot:scaffold36639_cov32-Tisochrysis_lutea.AAC.1
MPLDLAGVTEEGHDKPMELDDEERLDLPSEDEGECAQERERGEGAIPPAIAPCEPRRLHERAQRARSSADES